MAERFVDPGHWPAASALGWDLPTRWTGRSPSIWIVGAVSVEQSLTHADLGVVAGLAVLAREAVAHRLAGADAIAEALELRCEARHPP